MIWYWSNQRARISFFFSVVYLYILVPTYYLLYIHLLAIFDWYFSFRYFHFFFSLSATVTIVCLFTPKLYIILLHPEKNVRQSMMNKSVYQKTMTQSIKNGPGTVNNGEVVSNKKNLDNGKILFKII